MLLKKIDDTIKVISSSTDLEELKNNNKRVINLSKTLSEIYYLEQKVIDLQKEFNSRDLLIENSLNIKTYKNKLKQLTELIESGTFPTDKDILEIKYGIQQLLTNITNSWSDLVLRTIKPIIDLLDILKNILGDGGQASNVIRNLKHLSEIEPDGKSFMVLDKWLREGNAIISNLHLNDEINKFFEKVYLDKATVIYLTPGVLDWLKFNNLMESLKLNFHSK